MTCEHCNSNCDQANDYESKLRRCYDAKFDDKDKKMNYANAKLQTSSDWTDIEKEQIAKYEFYFFLEDANDTRLFWHKYHKKIRVTHPDGRIREGYIIYGRGKDGYTETEWYKDASNSINYLQKKFTEIKNEGIILFKAKEKKLQEQKNRDALNQAAQQAKDQGLHLDPSKYTDLKTYLVDLEKLKATNQKSINSLKVSPEEHAAALARLQQIQADLEKRKKLAQELEQTQIWEKITQQKHTLELTNLAIDEKGKAVKQAQAKGELTQAKQLNEEYQELRRKQGALLALIVNLEQNAAYHTFVKFDSLEQLYSPSYQWPTKSSVTGAEYQPTTREQVQPYVWGSCGLGGVVLVGYLLWRWLRGAVRG